MTETSYLGLKKPAPEDYYDVGDWNDNSDTLDQFAEGIAGDGGVLQQMQAAIAAAAVGLKLKGAVNYYANLPTTGVQEGDAYTVLYAGSSGTAPLGLEYAWAKYNNTLQWVPVGVDPSAFARADDVAAAQAETDAMLIELIDSGAKNRVFFTRGTETHNGVTFTVNDDLSVTLTGTASQYFAFRIIGDPDNTGWQYGKPIERGTYILSGLPTGASATTFRYLLGLMPSSAGTRTSESIYDVTKQITVDNDTTRYDLSIYVATNAAFTTPVTIKPMICKKKYYTRSTKYVPGSPTNAELFEMIRAAQT